MTSDKCALPFSACVSVMMYRCPHCNYSNVEKTKVRLHVKTIHPGKSTYVRTNREMLTWMADEVRKFFARVDRHGNSTLLHSVRCS
jgi:hypothetical protein